MVLQVGLVSRERLGDPLALQEMRGQAEPAKRKLTQTEPSNWCLKAIPMFIPGLPCFFFRTSKLYGCPFLRVSLVSMDVNSQNGCLKVPIREEIRAWRRQLGTRTASRLNLRALPGSFSPGNRQIPEKAWVRMGNQPLHGIQFFFLPCLAEFKSRRRNFSFARCSVGMTRPSQTKIQPADGSQADLQSSAWDVQDTCNIP